MFPHVVDASARIKRGVRGMHAGLVMASAVGALGIVGAVVLLVQDEPSLASVAFGSSGLLMMLVAIVYSGGRQALEAAGAWPK